MTTMDQTAIVTEAPTLADHQLILWLKQGLRQAAGRRRLQEDVLDRVVRQARTEADLLGVVLFGSLARGDYTWRSDIDLLFVYDAHDPAWGLVNRYLAGVEVQYFYATLAELLYNQAVAPYLFYFLCGARVLYDREGTVRPIVTEIEGYYAAHPEVAGEWAHLQALHQEEKRGPRCQQTTIMQRWDELEARYSGNMRRRTFFLT